MVKPLTLGSSVVTATAPTNSLVVPVQRTNAVVLKPIQLNELADLGGAAAKTASTVSDKIIASSKAVDMESLGEMLLSTVKTAQGLDPSQMKFGIFGMFRSKLRDIRARFETLEETLNKNIAEINKRAGTLKGRVSDLEAMSQQIITDSNNIKAAVADITARADWMEQNVPDVIDGDMQSAQYRSDWLMAASMGRKRADDLSRLLTLFTQQEATIVQMKQNAIALIQKMNDLQTTSVPAVKMAFQNYIIQLELKKGAEFADAQDALTNAAITKAAELHGQNTKAVMTSLTRSNIELSTLQTNQQSIIDSLNASRQILQDMHTRIKSEAPQLEQMSTQIVQQLSKGI